MAECPFCLIADGANRSVEIVAEAELWLAFFPLSPVTAGHTLVIPRHHARDFWDSDPETVAALAVAALQTGTAIERALAPEGMNLITSAGAVAEQTVPHVHLHIVPRWRVDDFGPIWPRDRCVPPREVSHAAERIRACFAALNR